MGIADRNRLNEFATFLTATKHRAGRTVKFYRKDLEDFEVFLFAAGLGLLQATQAEVTGFLSQLRRRGFAKRTINCRRAALHSFYSFCLRQQWLKENPVTAVPTERVMREAPVVLPVEQIRQLLRGPPLDQAMGLRDRAILALLCDIGLRVSEVAGLNLNDVDCVRGRVTICQPGRRERSLGLSVSVVDYLAGYLQVRPAFAVRNRTELASEAFFLNRDGQRPNVRMIRRVVSEYGQRTGLGRGVSPFRLRHSCAALLRSGGVSWHEIKQTLGGYTIPVGA